ncbi:hypothetical protein GCM10022403_041700 [Streptomyces coacervatus]|uniref:serine-type D-Ala-D-Ala carboxypeptidase n=1 Tax=Streptomyces coacervatus TaxID=647381 RepID=A0ABP7HUE8_9ACTN
MAGESPDRSKKRESSAEPTSGKTGPVPETRTQERDERDPRLAVARDTGSAGGSADGSASGSASGSSGEAGARGGVDTATRVFSVRGLVTGAAEGAGDAASAEDAEGSASGGDVSADAGAAEGEAVTGGTAGDAPGDARLRAAVAAWVRSGDSKGPESPAGEETAAEAAGAGDSGDGEGSAGEVQAAGAGGAADSEGSEGSGGAAGEEAAAEAVGAGDSGEPGESEDAVDAEGADSASAGDADADGDGEQGAEAGGTGPGDADEPEADATDEPADADDKAAEPAVQTDGPVQAEVEDRTNAEPEAGGAAADDSDEDSAPEAATDGADTAAADGEPAAADGKGAAATDGKLAAADGADAAVTDGERAAADANGAAAADSEPAVADGAGAAADDAEVDATAGDPAAARGSDAAAPGDEPPAADPTEDEPAAADGEDTPQGPPAVDDESGTGGAGGNNGDAEGGAEAEAGGKGVDQPTAVFKRPSAKPQVDQPTTMLKLGGAKSPKTPEPSEAERTSKFVALKPLDEPRTPRKPADVTAAVPQVGPERTAQQPLPPKPPLDLLAELTNTPPPPQTPVRTIIRRVKIWTPLVLLLAIIFAIVQSVRPLPTPTLALTADDSYTFDGTKAGLPWPNEGQGWMDVNGIGTMGSFGKQTPVPIGSVAKAMTAYIVLKDHPLKQGEEGKKITVDALAEKEGGYDKQHESTLNTVKKGDVLTEKQALSAIMIPSANNIARLLARWDMGSEAAFIKRMNDTAKELGMKNTTYTDASGLKESTVSTAEDQVKLGNELVKIPALMDITKLPFWFDPSGKKWKNYDALVPYNGAIGIKTGTTTKAGGNLLFAATKEVGGETVTVVGAILDQQTAPIIDTVNNVSKTAMLAARDALTSTKILKKGEVVGYVDDQLGGHTPIVLTKDVAAVGWAGLKVKLSFDADDVPHTAKAGAKVGTLTVGDGTSGAVKVPVALQKDLTEPGFTAKLKRLA